MTRRPPRSTLFPYTTLFRSTRRAWPSGLPSWARTKPPAAAAHPARARAAITPASEKRLAPPPPHERVECMAIAWIFGLQAAGLPAGVLRLLQPSQPGQHVGESRVRLGVIGLDADRLAIGPLAGFVLALLLQRGPEVEVALRIVGLHAKRLAVDGLRPGVEPLSQKHATEAAIRSDALPFDADR